jgi:ribonuclease BN (tRNA processing enzyme)
MMRMTGDYLKFLGTAGARFVVMKQLRRSGGIWLSLNNTNILVDPGPGSLIRCLSCKPMLNPRDLDGIVLTHRHLDHSNDVNILIESMTNGGFDPKGVILAPTDALDDDPVILQYLRRYVDRIERLGLDLSYRIGNIDFSAAVAHHHGVETYGLNISSGNTSLSYVADTGYFDGLERYYHGEVLIINVVLLKSSSKIQHLSLVDAEKIIEEVKPKLAILTHFGMTMLRAKPWELAVDMTDRLGVKVIAANDGMQVDLGSI